MGRQRRGLDRRDIVRTLSSAVDGDENARAALDLARIASDPPADRGDLLVGLGEPVGRHGRVPGVPRVGVPQSDEDALAGAEQQRHTSSRPRKQDGVLDGNESPGESDPLAGEQAPYDLEGLGEARDAAVERKAEGPELRLVPAGADPEHEPAARDLVHGRGRARQHAGSVEGRGGDKRPSRTRDVAAASAASCVQTSHGPRSGRPSRGRAGGRRATRSRSRPPRRPGDRAQLRPANLALDLGKLDADPERRRRHRDRAYVRAGAELNPFRGRSSAGAAPAAPQGTGGDEGCGRDVTVSDTEARPAGPCLS